jgi:hypothetical protein
MANVNAAIAASSGANEIAASIASDSNLFARVQAMLPNGMTVAQATAGFRNQRQFMAALNASASEGVSFVALKNAMTVNVLTLGEAVRQLHANARAN